MLDVKRILGRACGKIAILQSLATQREFVISGNAIRQELERNETTPFNVLGLVDDAHATAAKLFDDAVARDCLTDHFQRWVASGHFILRMPVAASQRKAGLLYGDGKNDPACLFCAALAADNLDEQGGRGVE
jgi:hypothetical protein